MTAFLIAKRSEGNDRLRIGALLVLILGLSTVETSFLTASCRAAEPMQAERGALNREGLWGTNANATHYEILSRPPQKRADPKPRTQAPEVIRPVSPYAYGWFGPSPTQNWYRQFGHQHSYVQFTRR